MNCNLTPACCGPESIPEDSLLSRGFTIPGAGYNVTRRGRVRVWLGNPASDEPLRHHAICPQGFDLIRKANLVQDFVAVLSQRGCVGTRLRGSLRKSCGRSGLPQSAGTGVFGIFEHAEKLNLRIAVEI